MSFVIFRLRLNELSKLTHTQLLLIDIFIIGGAIQAVIRFYKRLKTEMRPEHHALGKLISLKGIVIFLFLQEVSLPTQDPNT